MGSGIGLSTSTAYRRAVPTTVALVLILTLYQTQEPRWTLVESWKTAPLDAISTSTATSTSTSTSTSGSTVEAGGSWLSSRFVVGISNGHQGTSFLGSPKRYLSGRLSKESVAFFFEGNARCVRHPCKVGLFSFCDPKVVTHPLRRWYAAIQGSSGDCIAEQKKLVEEVCLPSWMRRSPSKVAVLGHDVIFYFQGLQRRLNETLFIRLRRPRFETARSFTLNCQYGSNNPLQQFEAVGAKTCWLQVPCKKKHQTNAFTLCPLERSQDIALAPPSVDVWVNMSYFQRALWYVDELEARWTLFLEANPEANFIELRWSSEKSQTYGSMKQVHTAVAQVLGLLPSVDSHAVKQHVKSKAKDPRMQGGFEAQDLDYKKKMLFTMRQRALISKVQFLIPQDNGREEQLGAKMFLLSLLDQLAQASQELSYCCYLKDSSYDSIEGELRLALRLSSQSE